MKKTKQTAQYKNVLEISKNICIVGSEHQSGVCMRMMNMQALQKKGTNH